MHVDTSLITPPSFHGTTLWLQAGVRKCLSLWRQEPCATPGCLAELVSLKGQGTQLGNPNSVTVSESFTCCCSGFI